MNDWAYISVAISLIFSILAFIAAIGCIAYTVGLRNSTHHIEWRPLTPPKTDLPGDSKDESEEDEDELYEPKNY